MKKTEITLVVITSILFILRFIWGVPVNLMLRISLTILSVFYLWTGFFLFNNISFRHIYIKHAFKGIDAFKIASGIGMGVVYSVSLISIMYAINIYSGMNFMLGFSLFCLLTSLSFYAVYYFINNKSFAYVRQYFIRSIVLIVVCTSLLSISVDKRLDILYGEYPEFIQAYKNHNDNPEDSLAAEKLKEERSKFR